MKAMRYSFVMVGVWWVLFSQYTYYFLPKGNKNANKSNAPCCIEWFKELKKYGFIKNIALKRYLGGFFVSSMAVQTVMLVATYFGAQEIAWSSKAESTTV
jgi:UMF1 family MFS transporter